MSQLTSAVRLGEQTFLALFPHGGQRRSRTNAWQAMVADRRHIADRAAADRALSAAKIRATDALAAETRAGEAAAPAADRPLPRALAGLD